MRKIITFLLFILVTSISCERDDLCPETTPTTPNLIIRAYDVSNQDNKKNIPSLTVKGDGNNNFLSNYKTVTVDSIVLPLKTGENFTTYRLYNNSSIDDNDTPLDESDDVVSGNEDVINIQYTTREVYVSRACGFKTVFENVTIEIVDDADNWILLEQPVNDNQTVEDETAAHFKIFH